MNLDTLISKAIEQHASDIHLLLQDDCLQLRYRIFGKLSPIERLSSGKTLANRIKIAADLNVAETRRTQEGQFTFQYNEHMFFIRVSIVNSVEGEKFALRVLSPFRQKPLQQLGLTQPQLKKLVEVIREPGGLILVCGATGSGKTTTLYSCINEINDGSRSIYTIEDPVELPISSIYQFEPDEALSIDTHHLLKAFMRQDPDVIMVGEIRDAKTADLAISAALTGHLVLATLHTNSALNIVHRCQNWQVDYFALVSTLKFVIHQSMTYSANAQSATFTTLSPNWGANLPANYQALIERNDLWIWNEVFSI